MPIVAVLQSGEAAVRDIVTQGCPKGETVTIERRFRANVADTSSGNGGSILTVGAADGVRPAQKKARRFHRALACIIPDYFGMSPSMPST